MKLKIKYKTLLAFLIFFGLITVPASVLLSKPVFLSIFFLGILILFYLKYKKINLNQLIIFVVLFIYLIFTAIIRPDNLLVSVRFFFVIITGYIAFSYSKSFETNDILKFVKIIFFFGLLSGILGLVQFTFGYSSIDLPFIKFSLIGLIDDFQKFNRSRSLGVLYDPLSQGILLAFTLHIIIFLNKIEKRYLINFFYVFSFALILLSLLATLNRTTILATLLSFMIYFNFRSVVLFFLKKSWIIKFSIVVMIIYILILLLNLPEFENVNIAFKSILRAFGIYDNSEIVGDYFSRGKTVDIRINIISQALELLKLNPFGLKEAPIFSIDDAGIFSPLLKYGFFGGGIIILFLFLPLISLIKFLFSNKKKNTVNYLLKMICALYITILILNFVSFSLDGTITILPFWLIIFLVLRINFLKNNLKNIADND